MTKKFDDKFLQAMKNQYDKNVDGDIIKSGMKDNKQLKRKFITRILEIERYIGANKNYEADYQDDNYKYNKLRTKLIKHGVIK